MSGILGKKIGMLEIYEEGKSIPVTLIEAGPCSVVDVRVKEKNGYSAAALSFGKKSAKKTSKAMKTIFAKAKSNISAIVREFDYDNLNIGDVVKVDSITSDYVNVSAISKGKGFQGVMKRHNFAGGPASHGSTLFHRRPGSIGNFASSGRVFPGKKMPGHMGNSRVTVKNLKVVKIDSDRNLLLVKGSVPGSRNSYLEIRPSGRTK